MSGNKIGCYKPWATLYFENSSNNAGPCCWLTGPEYGKLNNDSNLSDVWGTDAWEKLRRDMYEADGGLPTQCRLYCNGKQTYINPLYQQSVIEWAMNDKRWELPPQGLALTVANACNLKCKLCWIFDDFDYVIPMEGAERVIKQIRESVIPGQDHKFAMNLSGGEVFYAKPMRKLVYQFAEDPTLGAEFQFGFITNSTVYEEKWWELIKNKRHAICDYVTSVDGWDVESYKNSRGRDMFDQVLTNVDKVIKWRDDHMDTHGYFNIFINSLIMTKTYPHLKDIIDLWWNRNVKLQFIPLIVHYKPDDSEQVYNIPELREDCLVKLNEALDYINSKEITVWYQEENRNSIVRSLKDNIEYLNNLIKGSQTR